MRKLAGFATALTLAGPASAHTTGHHDNCTNLNKKWPHGVGLAKAKGSRFVLASTSEVYGDPLVHPQAETYWGNVNPIGPRGVYDEAKRYAEAMTMAYHRHHGIDANAIIDAAESLTAGGPVRHQRLRWGDRRDRDGPRTGAGPRGRRRQAGGGEPGRGAREDRPRRGLADHALREARPAARLCRVDGAREDIVGIGARGRAPACRQFRRPGRSPRRRRPPRRTPAGRARAPGPAAPRG